MKRGDIYLVDLNPTSGHEEKGRRPVLIVSPHSFNIGLNTPVILPITTGGNAARLRGFTVSLDDAGTQTKGKILCCQPRALDISSRKGRLLESVPDFIMDDVLAKLATVLE